MSVISETRPRANADRVKEASLDRDGSGNTPFAEPSQGAQADARDLLRNHAYEVALRAAEWAECTAKFVACDDEPGLRYCTQKFVAFARETARSCKELLDGAEGGQ